MRKWTEPTARNLLRQPLVLGVPFPGLLCLTGISLAVFTLGGGSLSWNVSAFAIALLGYIVLRILHRLSKRGWEEAPLFWIENYFGKRRGKSSLQLQSNREPVMSPDTLSESDLLSFKDTLLERFSSLQPKERLTFLLQVTPEGGVLHRVEIGSKPDFEVAMMEVRRDLIPESHFVYSLYQLPVTTDPLWFFGIVSKLPQGSVVITSLRGTATADVKSRIEHSRRSHAEIGRPISNIDSEVTFEEASLVLQGLSRGDDVVLEATLLIASPKALPLDPALFCLEKSHSLAALSALGVRRRMHRSHFVRAVTACDLIPNVADPCEEGPGILKTLRGAPLYFSPQDPRLEALHWLVVGASGSGKSFFTGLMLKRMVEQGCPMSVFFVDHNRSFRRFTRSIGGRYFEPRTFRALDREVPEFFDVWNSEGTLSGIELSDLDLNEKRAAIHALLSKIETFLRFRNTVHPFYLVLDECWNFMRDEPVLVQRAFREFRKLNGAVIAITQSLSDFLTDESGQSIFQNAPIRVLLRQGEDVGRYQGILGLNEVELARVSRLRQERGIYSECLIKTPFLSKLGRLYPTEEEHALLRTDNLRAELIAEAMRNRSKEASCV